MRAPPTRLKSSVTGLASSFRTCPLRLPPRQSRRMHPLDHDVAPDCESFTGSNRECVALPSLRSPRIEETFRGVNVNGNTDFAIRGSSRGARRTRVVFGEPPRGGSYARWPAPSLRRGGRCGEHRFHLRREVRSHSSAVRRHRRSLENRQRASVDKPKITSSRVRTTRSNERGELELLAQKQDANDVATTTSVPRSR